MKQTTYQPSPPRPRHLLLIVGLVCLSASSGLEMFAAENAVPANTVSASAETAPSERTHFYTVDFSGGSVEKFVSFWKTNFPGDSFIVLERVRKIELPPFQVRHVVPKEIGRSLEFLSEGGLAVEVERSTFFNPDLGRHVNLWRIGSRHPEDKVVVKMRAVAAPNLLQGTQTDEPKLKALLVAAQGLEEERIQRLQVAKPQEGVRNSTESYTAVHPLNEQKVFVLMGGEEGVAAMENFIQAAEQAAQPRH